MTIIQMKEKKNENDVNDLCMCTLFNCSLLTGLLSGSKTSLSTGFMHPSISITYIHLYDTNILVIGVNGSLCFFIFVLFFRFLSFCLPLVHYTCITSLSLHCH
jgi:hypothetical protein